jgi:hypothetical protein
MKKVLSLLSLAFALSIGIAVAVAQTHGGRERFTAFAVNLDSTAVAPAGAGVVEMVVERYSTDAERDRLMKALMEKGPEKLLDTLQSLPRVGYIRTPNTIGYDLRYARKAPLPEGGERVVLATDRYIGFWEAANRPRTIDYPFTIIELRLNRDGVGEGKMSLATRITVDKEHQQIELENYGSQPVLLKTVRREPAS